MHVFVFQRFLAVAAPASTYFPMLFNLRLQHASPQARLRALSNYRQEPKIILERDLLSTFLSLLTFVF